MVVATEVLIVGAGPTGLLLAGDLAQAGVEVTVLERRTTESNLTRAFAVHARTLEQLDLRGVADQLVETGTPLQSLRLFGGLEVDLGALPSRFPYLLVTPQYETEAVLRRRAEALGVPITRGAELLGLEQDETGATARVRTSTGAATYRAAYVVGADGVHSRVREALGLPFPGKSVLKSLMLADVRLTDPPRDVLTANGIGNGFAFVAPFGDGWFRVIAWDRRHQLPDDAPVDLTEIQNVTRRAFGTDFGMHSPRWLSRFHSDERQVPRYRVGRVFLAGDAAHVHSPAGGMGMNTSLQDAANLGWKLAAAVRGWEPAGLLDTYHAERHPVGQMVLRGSGGLTRMALLRPAPLRKLRNFVAARVLRSPTLARAMTGRVTGLGIRYPAPPGAHPLVGTRMPDLELTEGRLYEALRGGRFALVVGPNATIDGALPEQVDIARTLEPQDQLTLVRPDGYIGWVGTVAKFNAWARTYFDDSAAPAR